ncbi:hypothetical protein PH210_02150 [Paenibacillus sp. BSR1-1]|uniref:hypothetical protein n=1 Tax=Paenibacillus sp. BSR1-1 TaxID=3020845 RepID=UPI0025B226CD|nr:hypothetical protein [Paenibacillus sp. BSR1-1]MDN3015004.1 hypothetical protein [Paenibacillus sp. BSR1-1]
MVMALKCRSNAYKFVIIFFLIIGGLLIPNKVSFASNSTIIGFMIEAAQMDGTMSGPSMIAGDTSQQKDLPMLELNFKDLTAEGLTIKKLVKTPNGIVTLNMTPNETVHFDNLSLNVTNAEFTENYLPDNGNIGLKNVKLLAHKITTGNSNLPQFKLSFNEGGQVELEPEAEAKLIQLKTVLEGLLSLRQP